MSEFVPKADGIAKNKIEKTAGPWREAWNGFKKSKVAVVGMGIVLFFILLAGFGFLRNKVFLAKHWTRGH